MDQQIPTDNNPSIANSKIGLKLFLAKYKDFILIALIIVVSLLSVGIYLAKQSAQKEAEKMAMEKQSAAQNDSRTTAKEASNKEDTGILFETQASYCLDSTGGISAKDECGSGDTNLTQGAEEDLQNSKTVSIPVSGPYEQYNNLDSAEVGQAVDLGAGLVVVKTPTGSQDILQYQKEHNGQLPPNWNEVKDLSNEAKMAEERVNDPALYGQPTPAPISQQQPVNNNSNIVENPPADSGSPAGNSGSPAGGSLPDSNSNRQEGLKELEQMDSGNSGSMPKSTPIPTGTLKDTTAKLTPICNPGEQPVPWGDGCMSPGENITELQKAAIEKCSGESPYSSCYSDFLNGPTYAKPTKPPVPTPDVGNKCGDGYSYRPTGSGRGVCVAASAANIEALPSANASLPDQSSIGIAVAAYVGGLGSNAALGQNPNPVRQQKFDFELYDEAGELVKFGKFDSNLDKSNKNNLGIFASGGTLNLGSDIPTGKYKARIRFDNTLWKSADINLTPGNIADAPSIELVPGDIDQDNVLSLGDYNALISCYNNGICANKDQADLNLDGKVDELDLNIMLKSFKTRQGD